MQYFEEILALADRLDAAASIADLDAFKLPTQAVIDAAKKIGRAWSGSWLGYHANVYHGEFTPPPPGAHFSQEWGNRILSVSRLGSRGDWREYRAEDVVAQIMMEAGEPDLAEAKALASTSENTFHSCKNDAQVIIESYLSDKLDNFILGLKKEIDDLELVTFREIIDLAKPSGQIMTRDTTALGQGFWIPPHIRISAEVSALRHSAGACAVAAKILRKAGSYMERCRIRSAASSRVGTHVFIGHGRSGAWRELKDFLQDRIRLPYDEFNRVPVAGVTNIARIAEMLDAAAIALLVMTAEDEMADGVQQARMNVIHEAGLFQGRLGFSRAIVMLEDGCAEFSNIQGLGQIRFPRGRISAAFEEVRQVLEREGLI